MASSQDTICTLCFETFKNPLLLKCGHSLCEPCVKRAEGLYSALNTLEPPSKKKDKKDAAPAGPSLACPLCGKVTLVSDAKPNITLRNVLSLRQNAAVLELPKDGAAAAAAESSAEGVCGFCKGPAVVYCAFCGPLCQEHSDFLHVKGPLRSHELSKSPIGVVKTVKEAFAEVNGGAAAAEANTMVLPLCKDHGKQMELFCSKCETLVCSHCILIGEHKGHECSNVVQAFKKTNERVEELLGKIKQMAPECDALSQGYDRLSSGAEKEHEAARATVRDAFKQFREIVDECQVKTENEVDEIFKSFKDTVTSRTVSLRSLRQECELIQKSADTTAARNDLIRYTLFKSLKNLVEHLSVVSSMKVPDDATICQVDVKKNLLDKDKFSLVNVRSAFRMGLGRVIYYNINFDALEGTRNVTSEIRTGNDTSHDGGAIYDPVRRLILSVSGNYNNCRNLKITRMTDDTHGETTLMPDVIPFGGHGQYPVYDGRQFTYFFQSEDGPNNSLGRVDLDTMAFERLPELPRSSYREFCRGCCQGGNIYIVDRELNVWEFNTDTRTWRQLRCTLPRPCCFMADPADPNVFYAICTDGRGVFAVNIQEESCAQAFDTPSNFSLGANGEAVLVRTSPSEFIMFSCLSAGWHAYSSERRRWVHLDHWRNTRNGSGHLVIIPEGPRAFYHVDDTARWELVDLSPRA